MNLYFLVEGRRTESKVYPRWLGYLVPQLERVQVYDEVEDNNYYLFNGGGFPSIYDHIINSIHEVNEVNNYDYLAICLDADEATVTERTEEIYNLLEKKSVTLKNCRLQIIIQNRCIETWFLGNSAIYPRFPDNSRLADYQRFYNVSTDDPELMGIYEGFNSYSQFHKDYLKLMLLERHIRYTVNNPNGVIENSYLNDLKDRVEVEPDHLRSFQTFLEFCESLVT